MGKLPFEATATRPFSAEIAATERVSAIAEVAVARETAKPDEKKRAALSF